MKKKGITPIIATILLIAIVMVIASIVFFWFRSLVPETVTKYGKNIALVCEDVEFAKDYSSGTLYIVNDGNVEIESLKIEIDRGAVGHETVDISDLVSNWPENGLNKGETFSSAVDFTDAEKIILFPVLVGNSEDGEVEYECLEERHGREIFLR